MYMNTTNQWAELNLTTGREYAMNLNYLEFKSALCERRINIMNVESIS